MTELHHKDVPSYLLNDLRIVILRESPLRKEVRVQIISDTCNITTDAMTTPMALDFFDQIRFALKKAHELMSQESGLEQLPLFPSSKGSKN